MRLPGCAAVAKRISFRLAGRLRRSLAGPAAHSFHHRGRKEDQRGCYGAQAHRFERSACFGPDIGPWRWWWRIETERFRHMMPPENLKIDCVPAEYPDDPADSPQPSHRQISGRCRCCMHLVYHGCWLATCLPAVQDVFRRLPCEGGQDERRWRPNVPYCDERRAAIRSSACEVVSAALWEDTAHQITLICTAQYPIIAIELAAQIGGSRAFRLAICSARTVADGAGWSAPGRGVMGGRCRCGG
jgi:hypothetical protein